MHHVQPNHTWYALWLYENIGNDQSLALCGMRHVQMEKQLRLNPCIPYSLTIHGMHCGCMKNEGNDQSLAICGMRHVHSNLDKAST